MTEATASARGFLSSFEAAIHLQKSPFSFHNKIGNLHVLSKRLSRDSPATDEKVGIWENSRSETVL